MRIAHVTDVYLPRVGGIERQVQQLAQRQAVAGHDPHVVTATTGDGRDDAPVGVSRLAAAGLFGPGPVVQPGAWRDVAGVLHALAPDVVHVHASVASPLGLVAAMASRRAGRPTVVTVHSMWAHLSRPYRALFAAIGLDRLPLVWSAVSSVAAEQVQQAVGAAHRVRVLPNGIDPAFWAAAGRRVRRDEVHVASVLRLTARKRPVALLAALRRARAALPPDIRLRASLIGDGPLRAAVRGYLAAHRMPWVELLGRQSREQVRSVLHDADVFVAAARLESFGIAALEARCAAVPVIAHAGTGVADFIRHGREGLLARDGTDLAAALTRLAGSPDARAAIAAHNRATQPPITWADTLAAADRAYRDAAVLAGRAWHPARVAEAG